MELPLPALRGSSLLGFLAALGAFRTLAIRPQFVGVQMRWTPSGNSYAPTLRLPQDVEVEVLVTTLHESLGALSQSYVINADKDLKISRAQFRQLARRAAHDFLDHTGKDAAAMVAAFGCDAIGNDDGNIEDTGFRTMSGAGHQHFLEFMKVLATETTAAQIHEALFGPWRYRDASPTMRWDTEDDRRYALRWDEPSKDPVRTVRGANLLAIAALPLFPVLPISNAAIATAGFVGKGSRDTFFNWPIWSGWLDLDSIRSVVALKDLHIGINNDQLPHTSIAAVYRSQRITLGKYRNFTPASSI